MKTFPSALFAAGALLTAAHAEPAPSPPPSSRTSSVAIKSEPTLTLDFPGGSLGDLIKTVEGMSGEPALNVIGEKAALATEVQAFTVRNANRDIVLMAIGQLLRSKGVRLEAVGNGVFIVSSDASRDRRPPRAKTEAIFDSFQLGGIIDEQQSVDNIVDAIRTAWTLNPAHEANALQLKFHPGTKLLLVSGPPDAVEMTRQVIRSLHETRRPRTSAPPPPPKQ